MTKSLLATAALCTGFVPGFCAADTGGDVVAAMERDCLAPLRAAAPLGTGLTRADAAMEATLLNGKIGKVYRTENSAVVVIGHASGDTCDVMGLAVPGAELAARFEAWRAGAGASFAASADTSIATSGAGGGYFASPLDGGGFLQIFVTQHDTGFVGVTASRVADSAQAREVLGL